MSRYDNMEQLEMRWDNFNWLWTPGGHHYIEADYAANVRTASKYDDLQLLRLPNLKLRFVHD